MCPEVRGSGLEARGGLRPRAPDGRMVRDLEGHAVCNLENCAFAASETTQCTTCDKNPNISIFLHLETARCVQNALE